MPSLNTAREPLGVLFINTSMPVGGAETLQVNLIRRMDRTRFRPEVCCLKEPGPLGELLSDEVPVHSDMLSCKYDVRVLWRLVHLMRSRRISAVITVGAGDKMFWGRLAAKLAGVPVVVSALHSTGWPDVINRLNRALTPLTDAFIGVATAHGNYLVETEKFPASKVHVISNGVDIERFAPRAKDDALRASLGLSPDAPVVGIVAALRPEKNHRLFLETAALIRQELPNAEFAIVGDGSERESLEAEAARLGIADAVKFVGTRSDIPQVVGCFDLFMLTSHIEANPVSILEALASGKPVVATRVGSVAESVRENETGYLGAPGDAAGLARHAVRILKDEPLARRLGEAGRALVAEKWSLDAMVRGYEGLIGRLFAAKAKRPRAARSLAPAKQGLSA